MKTVRLCLVGKCIVCEKESVRGFTHTSCQTFYTPERLLAAFSYEGVIRNCILKGKYHEKTFYIFERLINLYAPFNKEAFGNALVVCIPLHKEKYITRGFNQSELLAKSFAKSLKLAFEKDVLVRVKGGETQSLLSKEARAKNIEDAFVCRKNIKGKDIILIDDICTTGATFLAATKALKKAGARFVWCFALAIVPGKPQVMDSL